MYGDDFNNFDPLSFLDLAKKLYENLDNVDSSKTAIERTIISRIYYATFLFVRTWLRNNTEYESKPGEHTKMPNYISKKGPFDDVTNADIAGVLRSLKKVRHQCDYYLEIPTNIEERNKWIFKEIDEAFCESEEIISAFNKIHRS